MLSVFPSDKEPRAAGDTLLMLSHSRSDDNHDSQLKGLKRLSTLSLSRPDHIFYETMILKTHMLARYEQEVNITTDTSTG